MRYFVILLSLFTFLSFNNLKAQFPEEFKISFTANNRLVLVDSPECQDEILNVTNEEITLNRLSESDSEARYFTTAKLPLKFYQVYYCSSFGWTITNKKTFDGSAEFVLVVTEDEKTEEFNYKLKVKVLEKPYGEYTSHFDHPNWPDSTFQDTTWRIDYYDSNKRLSTKVENNNVIYENFESIENGSFIFKSDTIFTEDVIGESFEFQQEIEIFQSEPQISSTEITPRKNFIEGTIHPLKFKAHVNWAGTPLKDRSAELIIDGNSYPISDVSTSTLETEINLDNDIFKGIKTGKEYPAKIKIKGADFTKTKEFDNDPVIFKPWSGMTLSDYHVTPSGDNLIYEYQNTVESNIKLTNSPTEGETVFEIEDNPFIGGMWGIGNEMQVTINNLSFSSAGNQQNANFTTDLNFYYGQYQNIDVKDINGNVKTSLKKGEGLNAELEFNYNRYLIEEQYHSVARLLPNGLTVTGNPGSILRGNSNAIKAIIQSQGIELPVKIKRDINGKIILTDNNEFEIDQFATKITNDYTFTYPVQVPGYGVVIMQTKGNADFEMLENNGSLFSHASGNVLVEVSTSALGSWHAMGVQPWPITQKGGIVKDREKNNENIIQNTKDSFISNISLDYNADFASYEGDKKVVTWYEKGNGPQTGNIFIKHYDGSDWSNKIEVNVDPEFAYDPKVILTTEDQIVLVCNANSEDYDPGSGPLDSLIKNLELHYTIYNLEDESITLQTYITDNNVADINHKMTKDVSGELHLFWQTADESIIGTEESPISIKYTSQGGGIFSLWEEPNTFISGLTDIKEWDGAAYDDDNVAVTYAQFLDDSLNKTDIYYKQMVDSSKKPVNNVLTGDKNNSSLHLFYDTNANLHLIHTNDSTADHRPLGSNTVHHFALIESFSGGAFNSLNAHIHQSSGVITLRMNNKIMYSKIEDVRTGTWSRLKVLDSATTDITNDVFLDEKGNLNLIAAKTDTSSTPGNPSHTSYFIEKDLFNVLDVKDKEIISDIEVRPNPVSNSVKIDLKEKSANVNKIKITDIKGSNVKTINSINNRVVKADVSSLSNGVYNILIYTDDDVISEKMIIK